MKRTADFILSPEEIPAALSAAQLRFHAARALARPVAEILDARLEHYSFDARRRHMGWQVRLSVRRRGDAPLPPPAPRSPTPIPPPPPTAPHALVIGSGPAGLFCALELLRAGIRVTLCERGKDLQSRRRDIAALNRGFPADPESNYCFGEGGAGTYSDGKLYTRSGKHQEVRAVLEELVAHGADPDILASWRPHIGSNRLPKLILSLREDLRRGGADLRFGARVVEILHHEGRADGVRLENGEGLHAEAVVLACGHSALDTLLAARRAGATLEAKGFAIGVRVEHPQEWLDEIQYHGHPASDRLPPSFYELSAQIDERGVYSFCMCPGGWIVPSQTHPAALVVNGMSLSRRDSPYANSGLVVAVEPKDWCGTRGARWGWPEILRRAAALDPHPLLHEEVPDPRGGRAIEVEQGRLPVHPGMDPLFGVRIQIALERLAAAAGGGGNRAPAQRCDRFVAAEAPTSEGEILPSSYLPGLTPCDFDSLLPRGITRRLRAALREFDRRLPGFAGERGQLIGVETRTSSPVRITRHSDGLQSAGLAALYPAGEGAGYAGGIVSAAIDGRRVAHALAEMLRARA